MIPVAPCPLVQSHSLSMHVQSSSILSHPHRRAPGHSILYALSTAYSCTIVTEQVLDTKFIFKSKAGIALSAFFRHLCAGALCAIVTEQYWANKVHYKSKAVFATHTFYSAIDSTISTRRSLSVGTITLIR